MEPSFEFSIIRAAPDTVRGEIVNIGVVVRTPDGVTIRLPELRKLRGLTGHHWNEIAALFEERLTDELQKVPSLAHAHSAFPAISEVFQVSAPGIIRGSPANLEKYVQSILRNFVARPNLSRTERQEKINTELKKFFRSREVLAAAGSEMTDHKVHPSFVVSTSKDIVADFAVKAKNYRIASTLDFRKPASVRAKVFEKGGTLWFAKQELGNRTELFGVIAGTPQLLEEHRAELDIFRDYAGGNVFNWMVAKERQSFAEKFY